MGDRDIIENEGADQSRPKGKMKETKKPRIQVSEEPLSDKMKELIYYRAYQLILSWPTGKKNNEENEKAEQDSDK